MSLPNRVNASHGFTLIELLVVISIIGLLAGILFPVFTSARSSSHKAVCQSNLRQLYTAFQLYAADWESTWPCPGGLSGNRSYWAQDGGGGIDFYLKNSGGTRSVYCCPAYPFDGQPKWGWRTYVMNSFLRDAPDQDYKDYFDWLPQYLTGIRPDDIPYPAQTILLFEGIQCDSSVAYGEGYVYRSGDWRWVRGYYAKGPLPHWKDADKPVHGSMNDYLMCDGHVVMMAPEKYPYAGPSGPENNLWYVNKNR